MSERNNGGPAIGDLRVWHIPQVPMKPFHVPVQSPDEAVKIIQVLADYDLFQFANYVKPDYCNASGLEVVEGFIDGEPQWIEWSHPETDEDIDGYAQSMLAAREGS
jgi:hypothetical protein